MGRNDDDRDEKVLKAKTTVIFKFSHAHDGNDTDGGGGGGFGSSLGVGDHVGGGGVVVNVTGLTVTVQFPGGVPEGPIDLPGSETTVVEEHSGTDRDVSVVILPWSAGDSIAPSAGTSALPSVEGAPLADGLHRSFLLPTPGSFENTVRLPAEFNHLILNPANTGTCPCAIFIGSMSASGQIVGTPVMLEPGKSVPVYEVEPGAAFIVASSSGGCTFPDCFSELTISLGVA